MPIPARMPLLLLALLAPLFAAAAAAVPVAWSAVRDLLAAKGLAGQQMTWSDAERRAVSAVQEFRTAMSLTDANGGYAIPFPIDPSIVLTNDGAVIVGTTAMTFTQFTSLGQITAGAGLTKTGSTIDVVAGATPGSVHSTMTSLSPFLSRGH